MNETVETSISEIKIVPGGIVRVQLFDNITITSMGLKENLEVYKQILGGEKGLFLNVFHEFNTAELNIKHDFEQLSRVGLKEAEAFVVAGLSNRIELDYYTQMTKTLYPTKVFNEEKEAIKWLTDIMP